MLRDIAAKQVGDLTTNQVTGDMTMALLFDAYVGTITLGHLGGLLGYIDRQSFMTAFGKTVDVGQFDALGLGSLTEQQLGNLTLLDLLDDMDAVALGDLLEALDTAGLLDTLKLDDLLVALLGRGVAGVR